MRKLGPVLRVTAGTEFNKTGQKIPQRDVRQAVERIELEYKNGVTIETGAGSWVDQHQKVVREAVLIVTIAGVGTLEQAERISRHIRDLLDQEAVVADYEGTGYLI
jgi:hypothetical protein